MLSQTDLKIKPQKIGKSPVVVLPLEYYEKMKEDLEMLRSKTLKKKIAKARKEKKLYSSSQVKRMLKL